MTLFQSLHVKPQQLIVPILVSLISFGFIIFEAQWFNFLGYFHSKISQGEVWRLFSGHFFHANFNHLLMNLAGLWCLMLLHGEYYHTNNLTSLFLISALTTALGMYFFSPQVEIYVGLSGILHGLVVYGALKDIQQKISMGFVLLLALIAKVLYEQIFGASDEVVKLIEMNVAINAHLFGAMGGALAFLLLEIKKAE